MGRAASAADPAARTRRSRRARNGYLTAYAQPKGGGPRIWYFSGQADSPRLPPSVDGTRPATRGIRIGAEHEPGDYVVHVALSPVAAVQTATAEGHQGRPAPQVAEARFDLRVVAR